MTLEEALDVMSKAEEAARTIITMAQDVQVGNMEHKANVRVAHIIKAGIAADRAMSLGMEEAIITIEDV